MFSALADEIAALEAAASTGTASLLLEHADKLNAKTILIIGEDELKNNTIWLKNLQTKEEKIVTFDEVKSSVWS